MTRVGDKNQIFLQAKHSLTNNIIIFKRYGRNSLNRLALDVDSCEFSFSEIYSILIGSRYLGAIQSIYSTPTPLNSVKMISNGAPTRPVWPSRRTNQWASNL